MSNDHNFADRLRSIWSPRQRLGLVVLGLSLIGAALALGSVHPAVLCVVTFALTGACVLLWWDASGTTPRRSATVLLVVAVGLVAYTALQSLPIPSRVVELLDWRTADVWAHALSPLREPGPSWHPLSLDPYSTRVEVLRGIAYLLAFLAVLRAGSRREGIEVLCGIIVLSVLVLAVVALLHPAFGAQRVFGVYKPENAVDERHISPLLNPNPLAAYLNVGICITLAASIAPRERVPRVVAAAVLVVFVATQLWVASRGGLVAMVLGGILVITMMRAAPGRRTANTVGMVAGALSIAGVAMMVLASSKDVWQEVSGTDVSKLSMQKMVLPIVGAHPWFGVGRGAFESAFPAFRSGSGHVLFTHPEHVIVQWISEWGLPVALFALAAIAWALRPQALVARSHLIIGPWAALCSAAVHNLVDLNSEVPAVMMIFAACAALVVAGTGTSANRARIDTWASRPRAVAAAAAFGCAFGLMLVLPTLGKDLYSDRRVLHELTTVARSDDLFEARAREAMLRHPSEPYLPFTGALRASKSPGLDAIPWAARTVECAPVYGPVHMVLGRTLRRLNPSQARMEYRIAMEQAPELSGYVLHEAVPIVSTYEDALELIPATHGDDVLTRLAPALGQRMPSTRALLDAELLSRDPRNVDGLLRATAVAVVAAEQNEPWCAEQSSSCSQLALAFAGRLTLETPTRCQGYALRARTLAAGGDPIAAADELSGRVAGLDDPTPCLLALIRVSLGAGLVARVRDATDRLARAPCATPADCAMNLVSAGEAEASLEHFERAMTFFRKAYERVPNDETTLERVAATAARLGLHAEAAETYARLSKRHPTVDRFRVAAAKEREAVGPAAMSTPPR